MPTRFTTRTRLLSCLLTLAMLLSLVPVSASALETREVTTFALETRNVTTFAELKTALKADSNLSINLMNDIDVSEQMNVSNPTQIDLNGHTLKAADDFNGTYFFQIKSGRLTLTNGTLYGGDKRGCAYVDKGTLTLYRDIVVQNCTGGDLWGYDAVKVSESGTLIYKRRKNHWFKRIWRS